MLNINRIQDLPRMKKYYRTNDMINLLLYFKDISPVRNITIIESVKDYLDNIDFCAGFYNKRIDTLIGKKIIDNIEVSKENEEIVETLEKIKKIDIDGVLVLFETTNKYSERYERYAGISVGVSVGNIIIIEAVGKGFDGREVSKGISVHERYVIPWVDIRKCNVDNFEEYRTYLINHNDYEQSRKERVTFLNKTGLDEKKFSSFIPEIYQPIPSFIWEDIIKNIIKKLSDMEEELISSGFNEFAISGHTEGKKFMPWQMFNKSRYIK